MRLAKILFICGLGGGLSDSVGNSLPKEIITNVSIYVIPMSLIGFGIGCFFPKKETYLISENEVILK